MIDQPSLAVYRQTARTRQQAQRAAIEARRQRAWQVARNAAALLRHDFGVSQIMAFGSITSEKLFWLITILRGRCNALVKRDLYARALHLRSLL